MILKRGELFVLNEIICDEFKKKKVIFDKGLNVVLGDEKGSNSIGKSTFLMIIDYVFGGNDYVKKSTDIQRNVGTHIIKFSFSFGKETYWFSRNTDDTQFVYICDNNYNVIDSITLDEYVDNLKELYGFGNQDISFRNVAGRYIRVYGKENIEEKRPLDVVRNEKAGQPVNALLKLFGLYDAIRDLEELAKQKKEKLNTYKQAQKYHFVSNIGARQRKDNDKQLVELHSEKERITNKLSNNLLDFDSEKADIVLKLKHELADFNKKIRRQRAKLIPLQDNVQGNRAIKETDLKDLEKFFSDINLRELQKIQAFHKEIDFVLREEIKQEITNIEGLLQLLQQQKEDVEKKIKEISEVSNLSQVILFEFAEIQKKIEEIENQNSAFDKRKVLEKEKKDADERKNKMRKQQLSQLQNQINMKMSELNDEIYKGVKVPPTITFDKNQYDFETVDDTGTGTNYRGMVLYDMSILKLTYLPILVHDSVLLKQIEDVAIEKILEMYQKEQKQIFIALDKVSSYSERSQEILNKNAVLRMGSGGNELFGRSWSKKE